MAEIHNRMPVMLDEADWGAGSIRPSPSAGGSGRCSSRATSRSCAIRAVSQLVNNVRNDGPDLVVPI